MNKKIISIFCMLLIVTIPLTLAQFSETDLSYQTVTSRTYGKQDLGEVIIVNVGGTEPTPIPSASVESGVTPIRVYIKGTTFGSLASTITGEPQRDIVTGLTNIPPIKSIIIQPDKKSLEYLASSPKYFKPVRNAYSLNNLGQILLNLKQIPIEEDVPDRIDLNFTATINFDLEQGSIFGVSQENLVLKQHKNEEEWLELPDSQKDRFFASRGYIRMSATERNNARFIIYDKYLNLINIAENAIIPQYSTTDLTKETSISLREGRTSYPITLGSTGDPFLDSFRIKLNQIIEPQDKAYIKLTINGNTYDKVLIEGKELYPGSKWKVRNIYIAGEKDNNKPLKRRAGEFFEDIKNNFGYKVSLEDLELPKNTNFIYQKTHVLELENRDGDIAIVRTIYAARDESGTQNILNQISKPMSEQTANTLILKYCPTALLKEEPNPLPENYYVCKAIDDYKEVIKDYPTISENEKELYSSKAALSLGDLFYERLIPYNDNPSYFSDMKKLALHFYSLVPEDSGHFVDAQSKINELTTTFGGSLYLANEGVALDLKRVQLLTPADKPKATIILKSTTGKPQKYSEDSILKYNDGTNVKGRDQLGNFEWYIEKIYPGSVVVRKKYTINEALGDSRTIASNQETYLTLEEVETQKDIKQREIYIKVTEIEANVEADVTILPGIGEAFSTSTFQVHLPIDQRPFKFSKSQIIDQINKTQELIEKLDKNIKKLDKLVKSLKKTCLVVSTALIIKNSFFTGAARNLARKEIMKVYDEKCRSEINQGLNRGKYVSQDGCYQHYSSEIEDSLDEGEDAVEKANDIYEKTTKTKEGKYTDKNFDNYILAGGTKEDYKKYLVYKQLSSDTALKDDKHFIESQKLVNSQIAYDRKIILGERAQQLLKEKQDKDGEFKTELEKQNYLQFLIGGLDNPEAQKVKAGEEADPINNPLPISNIMSVRGKPNELYGMISQPNLNVDTYTLIAPTQFAINMMKYPNEAHYRGILVDKKKKELQKEGITDENVRQARAVELVDAEISSQKNTNARNIKNQPIYIKTSFYNQETNEITKDVEFFTSNVIPFEGSQAIRNDYIEQTSYKRYNGEIKAQFNIDGYVQCYPIGQGDYALINEWYKTSIPDLSSTFIYNVGPNGIMECGKGDDVIKTTPEALQLNPSLKRSLSTTLNRAGQCKKEGDTKGTLKGTRMPIVCSFDYAKQNKAESKIKCTDTMDPSDCKLLFNVCDPVMCPSSRCNLGGRWQVDDVIGSGLIGSAVMCLPNRKDGVIIPVCLTGISAGLRNIKTILQGYQACLKTSLEEGRNVGLCDYIRSVGICEIVWKEALFITRAKGGILDWAIKKVSPNHGGEEYTRFQESFEQASKSFNYFTTEYSQSLLAQYKGKSFEEIGTEVCKLAVNGKLPNLGDVLDELSEPEDPPQFTAVFDEATAVTQSGLDDYGRPSEAQSYYRGFYHIYAGKGYSGAQLAPSGYGDAIQYSVYLKSTTQALPILYVTKSGAGRGATSSIKSQIVKTSFIKRGEFVQESINAYGESGYDQICVNINGKTSCGFGKASSTFSINYLQDRLSNDESRRGIDGKPIETAEQCRPDYPRTSPALKSKIMPQQFGMLNSGIVRVCNPTAPGPEDRWTPIGDCGKDKNNKYLGKCWLDEESIKINDAEKLGILKTDIEKKAREIDELSNLIIPYGEGNFALAQIDIGRVDLIEGFKSRIESLKEDPLKSTKEPESKKSEEGPSKKGEEPIRKTTTKTDEDGKPVIGIDGRPIKAINPPGKIIPINTKYIIPKPGETTKDGVEGGCRFDGAFPFDISEGFYGDVFGFITGLKNSYVKDVYVYAFASMEGKYDYNLQLSKERAKVIADLLTRSGLNVKTGEGKGPTSAFDPNEIPNPKVLSKNRRYIVSTSPITTFKAENAPEIGIPYNCGGEDKKAQISKEIIQSEKPIPEEDVSAKEYSLEFDNSENLKTINGNFESGALFIKIKQNTKELTFTSLSNEFEQNTNSINLINSKRETIKKNNGEITISVIYSGTNNPNNKNNLVFPLTGNVITITSLAEKPVVIDEVSLTYKEKVLNIAQEYYIEFNKLKTTKTDVITKEYTYQELIEFSANPKVSAEALLQRAEFYHTLAKIMDELIGVKPEVSEIDTIPIIQAKFIADTSNEIKITGPFDFQKYDYYLAVTDKNGRKTFIDAKNQNEEDVSYGGDSITLTGKYDFLKNNVKSILVTIYYKGTTDYPLNSITLDVSNRFGKPEVKTTRKTQTKEEDTDKCAECHEGWANPCSKKECNEISLKKGVKCSFISGGITPDRCTNILIVLDAGHGVVKKSGKLVKAPGATSGGNIESEENLRLTDFLSDELTKRGYAIALTRSSAYNTEFNLNPEVKPYLLKYGATNGRGIWANDIGAELFISVHNNCAGCTTPIMYPSVERGTAYKGNNHCGGKAKIRCDESKKLSNYIVNSMNQNYKTGYHLRIGFFRSKSNSRLGVFSGSKIVSSLIEFRPINDKALKDDIELRKMTAAAAEGIDNYIKNNLENIQKANSVLRKGFITKKYPKESVTEEEDYDEVGYPEKITETDFASQKEDDYGIGGSECKIGDDVPLQSKPCITAEEIDNILAKTNSPAKGNGKYFYNYGMQYGIDPAIALAFFKKESNLGIASNWALGPNYPCVNAVEKWGPYGNNPGNLRPREKDCQDLGGKTCISAKYPNDKRGYCVYPNWEIGIKAWYIRIQNEYINKDHDTIDKAGKRYSGGSNNYANDVKIILKDYRLGV